MAKTVQDVADPSAPILRRLLTKHELGNIAIRVNSSGVFVEANPTSFHRVVKERRDAVIAELGRQYPEGIPLSAASKITDDSMAAVGRGSGRTVVAALIDLETKLKEAGR